MKLLKRLFFISDNIGYDCAIAMGIHVEHAFLYGLVGGITSSLRFIRKTGIWCFLFGCGGHLVL